MSSPSSSSSATAGAHRSRRPSRNAIRRAVAAAALAAAAAWIPVAFLFAYGPLGFALWALFGLAALAFYFRTWHEPVLIALGLNAGALVLGIFALLVAGCGTPAGEVDDWMWAVSGVVAFAGAFCALLRPAHAWWALPSSTLAGAAVVVALAVALHGNTGLCPD